MGQQDNTRNQDQDIRRQPQQQEQTGGKSAKKTDKQDQPQQGRQSDMRRSDDDRMSRH